MNVLIFSVTFVLSVIAYNLILYMIQRIQSVYLLLVIIACVVYIFVPVGQIKTPENVTEIWLIKNDIPIMIGAIVVAMFAFAAIFLFNNRITQMKVVLIDIVLSVVLIGLFLFGLFKYMGIQNYTFGVGAILPIFILLFNILAYSSIKADENLVKSMDRLR